MQSEKHVRGRRLGVKLGTQSKEHNLILLLQIGSQKKTYTAMKMQSCPVDLLKK